MANTDGFNQELDKITEREVVYDFVSRLSLGKNMNSEDIKIRAAVLFKSKTLLKSIIIKLVSMLPISIQHEISNIGMSHEIIHAGSQSIFISVPGELRTVYSEYLGMDITKCFHLTHEEQGYKMYLMELDTPYTTTDIFKIYFIKS